MLNIKCQSKTREEVIDLLLNEPADISLSDSTSRRVLALWIKQSIELERAAHNVRMALTDAERAIEAHVLKR